MSPHLASPRGSRIVVACHALRVGEMRLFVFVFESCGAREAPFRALGVERRAWRGPIPEERDKGRRLDRELQRCISTRGGLCAPRAYQPGGTSMPDQIESAA